MKNRIIAIGISLAIIAVAILAVKALKSKNKKEPASNNEVKATLIQVITPSIEDVSYQLDATGKVTAAERFEIFAQVEGQLTKSANKFKAGKTYRKGEKMLEIDVEEFRMTLLAQKSEFITAITSILPDLKSDFPNSYQAWRAYALALDVKKKLPNMPEPEDAKEKFYLSGKGIYSSYYNIQSSEEKLAKYTIRAPFTGIVTSSRVVAGKAVRSGSELGVFINPTAYEVEITLPLTAMNEVKVGTPLTLMSTEISDQWQGKVIRIGGDIDELSQSVKVYIGVKGNTIKEGMFLTAYFDMAPFEDAMSVPRKMVNGNNEIFIVENNALALKKVTVLMKQGDKAIISGLKADTKIMSTVIKSAYDGMPVRINE